MVGKEIPKPGSFKLQRGYHLLIKALWTSTTNDRDNSDGQQLSIHKGIPEMVFVEEETDAPKYTTTYWMGGGLVCPSTMSPFGSRALTLLV